MPWPIKKVSEAITVIIFVVFAIAFFVVKQYWQAFWLLVSLIVLLKLDYLKKLIINPNSGFEVEFQIPEVNIKKDIKDNNESVNRETFTHFKNVEEQVLKDIHKKIGGKIKRQIHFMYGRPDRPEFVFTPDATIQTKTELIFLEIKYVLKPEFAKRIVEKSVNYLKVILNKFSPMAGNKLVIKLILASAYDLDIKSFSMPKGIEIELYKL